jgi:hypothetical protein
MKSLDAILELPPNFCLQVDTGVTNRLQIEPIIVRLLVPEGGPRNVQFGPVVKRLDATNRFQIQFHYEENEGDIDARFHAMRTPRQRQI